MKKSLVLIAFLGLTIFLANCAIKPPESFATKATTPEGQVKEIKQNYTDAQINNGMMLYKSHCNKCHRYHKPSEHTVTKWTPILVKMVHKSHLSNEEAGEVRAYILTNAKMG